MSEEKRREIRSKAESSADDARRSWNYAMTNGSKESRELWRKEAEFYLKLSQAYSEILKADNHENL
ncbi:MAG: hypothetical protein K9J21_07210 [Bacteroidales bacterium]|nr:hypothetical protein [Bacteroidales bacterium]